MTAYHKIVKYIAGHIKEDITITVLAREAGYSANYIYKLFRVYSPYPIMEYVRRNRLYAAANEMYTGRRLYDIALDYGYETSAGFYKAFKAIIGCSPSEYKNNIMKEGISMTIANVKDIEELESVLRFFRELHKGHPTAAISSESEEKFGGKWWTAQYRKNPELVLYAKDKEKICAVLLGFEEGGSVSVHEGVLDEYKNTGILEALFVELEKKARQQGAKSIALGIGEGEEEFYAKLGYIGKTLIQSEKHSIAELMEYNAQHNNYELISSQVYEGYVNQLWLDASLLDKELKHRYEIEIGDCWVQVIASKEL